MKNCSALLRRTATQLLAMVACAGTLAASAAPYRMLDSTIEGGGGHAQGTRFALQGTFGQADAGRIAGARFTLDGGFWHASVPHQPASDLIFRNSFED